MLVIDYRWGSMGSGETAITIPGGPWVIDVLTGDGVPSIFGSGARASQTFYFFLSLFLKYHLLIFENCLVYLLDI